MQVGSLCVCVDANDQDEYEVKVVLNNLYVIREIIPPFIPIVPPTVLLEEIVNPPCEGCGEEHGFGIIRFREVQPPMKI